MILSFRDIQVTMSDILTRLYANTWFMLVSFTNNKMLVIFRVQELLGQTEQRESTVESATEPEATENATEDTTDSPKPKKKKKKDKREKESAADESVNGNSLQQPSENNETTVDTMEVDSNSNRHHKEKKKKKKDKQQESDEILPSELPVSDSSGYISDKTSRKRAAESGDRLQDDSEIMSPAKKKKRNKWFLSQSI